jgi:hypothetical protein
VEPWRTIWASLAVIGAAVTVWGLVLAYRAAKRESLKADKREKGIRELGAELTAADVDRENGVPGAEARQTAAYAELDRLYASDELARPHHRQLDRQSFLESRRLLSAVLKETRRDFIIAGVGLAISTLSSVASLYLPAAT